MKPKAMVFVLALLWLWRGVGPVSGQESESPSPLPGVFSEVLDVRVVNLEVVVTDKDGIPIRGLGPGDFVLRVDGEEIPIGYFSEVRAGVAAPVSEAQAEMGVAELPAVVAGDPVDTSYLVFIDETFAIARDRDKVIQALIDQLPLLGPKDRMAIVAFNGTDLDMLTTWSQSVPALERTLEKAMQRPVYGLQRLTEQRQYDYDRLLRAAFAIRTGALDSNQFYRSDLLPDERFFLQRLTDQIQSAVTAATLTLRSFAKPPGRKVMMLYSGGWPFFPVTFLGPYISPLVDPSDGPRGADLFRPLTDTANLLGYTLYPVDMPGFNDLLAQGSEQGPFSRRPLPDQIDFNSFNREQEMHFTLSFMADETGGRALLNADRLTAFDRTVSDTRSYYWLGFSPQREWDDNRHKVDVEVKQPGFRVRSRGSYRDASQEREVTMALESTLLFGSPVGSESLLVELGEPRKAGRKKIDIPVAIYIPLSEVTLLPDEGGRAARLELQIAIRDEEGRRAEMPMIPMIVRTDKDSTEGVYGRFDTTLKMRNVQQEAVFGVFDPASGRILSRSVEISP